MGQSDRHLEAHRVSVLYTGGDMTGTGKTSELLQRQLHENLFQVGHMQNIHKSDRKLQLVLLNCGLLRVG